MAKAEGVWRLPDFRVFPTWHDVVIVAFGVASSAGMGPASGSGRQSITAAARITYSALV
ncbi:hypothetical protein [Streptomyces sp. NPDC048332]|uniref:hypothetical protein n=1 Tax=Streptomyces sp. NPDC048332 TaxID=3154619 RepID=UPI003417249D